MRVKRISWEKGPYVNSITGKIDGCPIADVVDSGMGNSYCLTNKLTSRDFFSNHKTLELAKARAQKEFDDFVLMCIEK